VAPVEIDRLTQGSLFLTRPGLLHHIADRQELLGRASDLFRWLAAGELHLTLDRVFPLAEVADAHRTLEARKTRGKVLLIP
jgi:NADPH2:quinone reductase